MRKALPLAALLLAGGGQELVGPWILDVDAGFAEAKKTGRPLAVVLRCVP